MRHGALLTVIFSLLYGTLLPRALGAALTTVHPSTERRLLSIFAPQSGLPSRSPVRLQQTATDQYQSHVQFAADAYCTNLSNGTRVGTDGIVLWHSGSKVDAQTVYVAYSPTLGLVVSHEGTNISSLASISNDANFGLSKPVPSLSWLKSEVQIARGFQDAWNDTADEVLVEVQKALLQYPNSKIVTTGHSLGASTALLQALRIGHDLNVPVNSVVFGLPRTGNEEFAAAVDTHLPTQTHITHYRDPVPHVPAERLGFRHPTGEVWIADEAASVVYSCPDQENTQCSNSVSVLQYDLEDHHGPYFGISMDCSVRLLP